MHFTIDWTVGDDVRIHLEALIVIIAPSQRISSLSDVKRDEWEGHTAANNILEIPRILKLKNGRNVFILKCYFTKLSAAQIEVLSSEDFEELQIIA